MNEKLLDEILEKVAGFADYLEKTDPEKYYVDEKENRILYHFVLSHLADHLVDRFLAGEKDYVQKALDFLGELFLSGDLFYDQKEGIQNLIAVSFLEHLPEKFESKAEYDDFCELLPQDFPDNLRQEIGV